MRLPALLGLLPLLATACQSVPPTEAPPPPQPAHAEPVIPAVAGTTTELATGELLRVTLEGNPSTGHVWAVDGALPAQLEEVSGLPDGPDTPASAVPMVGAPQTQWLHFRAMQRGSAELRLRWHRPWEGDAAPARTASYTITVR
ncbi:hypothetical protein ABB30_03585 [Stenotrophomonas ginsengisoli]|uniref:Proteinase inhibitor I42 chagasin domain-containing protein n=1 Tax=Stenotrophomonas ginsengisoli TaxID=336566 RepID=A0A0R0D7R7_9GAMM|nr:protease inhibitor I42 family protein [Stenotrophomonas ginsengisoli]KRG78409.1 hypothetical protein ABB30_03585 [Stenotrophomonas ginsengisoli]